MTRANLNPEVEMALRSLDREIMSIFLEATAANLGNGGSSVQLGGAQIEFCGGRGMWMQDSPRILFASDGEPGRIALEKCPEPFRSAYTAYQLFRDYFEDVLTLKPKEAGCLLNTVRSYCNR